jgi:membrane-bound lytic murein transglycosylase
MRILSLLSAVLLLAALAGCQHHPQDAAPATADSSSSSATSEAERTHEMERKAADLDKRAEDLKTMTGTDQEKIDAANQIDKERRELAEQADSAKH